MHIHKYTYIYIYKNYNILTQQTFAATLGSARRPSTRARSNGFKNLSLITKSGNISHTRPTVQAAVSRTTTLPSFNNSIKVGNACSTKGFRLSC